MLRQCRQFSTTRVASSYVGSAAIALPQEVSLSKLPTSLSTPRNLVITGPKGELNLSVPHYLKISTTKGAAGSNVTLSVQDRTIKEQRSMWGTTRALLNNSIIGVTEGFTVSLKFVGVGYRAAIDGTTVVLRVGFSKPVVLTIPDGVSANCPQPTALILNGRDKQVLTQFAAVIRSYRKPEPYKGKGIFVNNETIKIKSPAGKK